MTFPVKGIFHAGIARLLVEVTHDNRFRLGYLQDGHARNGRAFRRSGGRIHDVAGADGNHHIRFRKLVVYLCHVKKLVIVHPDFRKQDVHMSGHPAGHRVYRHLNLFAPLFQCVHEVFDRLLRLGEGHAVPGHYQYLVRFPKQSRNIIGSQPSGRFRRSVAGNRRLSIVRLRRTRVVLKSAQYGKQIPVHGAAHNLRKDHPGHADQRAHARRKQVAQGNPADGRRNTGKGIQERNDDRHIGAAHAQGEENAVQE
ncbi:MAG: hypothetical protein BWX80_04237 [Candidatus Hydrogenedentes bacterium ADurb.Bin101]|nr:MAG: hypothetical protein BWX80_04237 [Candidatus Hydrogenedentes bacterium ADurb.Bin101]